MNQHPTIQATETQTREVETLLPEEIQDILAEQALSELNEAKQVPFTPVQDAAKLDMLIAQTQKKLVRLLSLDVETILKEDLEGFAEMEKEDGETEQVAIVNRVKPSLQEIIKVEEKIASSVKRYQSILVEAMKAKRLLSGQMFGTRLSHSAQVSRMKRVRQITLTGAQMMEQMTKQVETAITPKQDMERIDVTPAPPQKIIELFPATEATNPNFDPLPDVLPYANIAKEVPPKTEVYEVRDKPEPKQAPASKPEKVKDLRCASYHDD